MNQKRGFFKNRENREFPNFRRNPELQKKCAVKGGVTVGCYPLGVTGGGGVTPLMEDGEKVLNTRFYVQKPAENEPRGGGFGNSGKFPEISGNFWVSKIAGGFIFRFLLHIFLYLE